MYIPTHFQPQELVPPDIYHKRGDKCFELIDDRVLLTLDKLRVIFGPCIVNDWLWNGGFSQRGLRTTSSENYSPTSQHTFGRAMDCSFESHTAEEVRIYIIKNKKRFPHISFIENDVTWLHFDVRNCQPITLWSPQTHVAQVV